MRWARCASTVDRVHGTLGTTWHAILAADQRTDGTEERGSFPWPHCSSDGGTIDGGEPTMVVDAGMAILATPTKKKGTRMKRGTS